MISIIDLTKEDNIGLVGIHIRMDMLPNACYGCIGMVTIMIGIQMCCRTTMSEQVCIKTVYMGESETAVARLQKHTELFLIS